MRTHGFAVLPQRLDRVRVDELASLYQGVMDEVGRDTSGAFLPSMLIGRPALRIRLWDGVRDILQPVLNPLFANGTTEVIGGSFVSKPSSPGSVRNPHQDPTTFDESRHVSLSVWIPLTDSYASNGTLFVLSGSHRMGNHVRPPDVDSLDAEVTAAALQESVPVEIEAGQMLVIDGAVVHHSPPNRSGADRVATICALRPAGADMRYVRSDRGAGVGTAEIYDVGSELYRSGDLVAPDLSRASSIERSAYRPVTLADLRASQACVVDTAPRMPL